ncbi:hypothetical protein [Geitlerinema sp. PCC 9228]|uniref:hypothetical protein n=1 Tax=Geitlerinema sp. PCC 9228 TaxID=111611 RepID=UPI0008F9D09B|nr:hypothetical protein [Geitlerinema sp. PCC 9228]
MKLQPRRLLASTLVGAMLTVGAAARAQEVIDVSANFSDPLTLTETSGGDRQDCGYHGEEPDFIINLQQDFTYLRFYVEGEGKPTLLMVGPLNTDNKARYCSQTDPVSGENAEHSGYWSAGRYEVYVGEVESSLQNPYELKITQERP